MTTEIPYIRDTETTEAQYPQGSGAKVICIMGETSKVQELDTIYEINNYPEAVSVFGELTGGDLLSALQDIFEEGAIHSVTDTLGIDKVYAINVGLSATIEDYTTAQATAEMKKDVELEVYLGVSDVSFMLTTDTRLSTLATVGQRRDAIFTTALGADDATIGAMTDPLEATYIHSSRVYIKDNRDMQAKFAAKVACTPYWQDPAKGPYRTVTMDDIEDVDYDRINTLTQAGIICDWEYLSPLSQSGKVEPAKAVATSYVEVDNERPVDSLMHCRLNADYQWRQLDIIIQGMLKDNETETGLQTMQEACESFLAGEAKKGYLSAKTTDPQDPGYMVEVESSTTDVYGVVVRRKIRPVNAIYSIEEVSVIQAPV